MDSLIDVVAPFTRLPSAVPGNAVRFEGAVTVWPSQYTGGSETGSAAIVVGGGRNANVFGLYLDPKAVSEYASLTEPQGTFRLSLGMRANDGAPEFSVVSVELPAKGDKRSAAMTSATDAPVMTALENGLLSVLWQAESESHLDLTAPTGFAWNPDVAQFVGLTLPRIVVAYERRLVEGSVQPKPRARVIECDPRLLVTANPEADLGLLTR